jgi:hypothetical protein
MSNVIDLCSICGGPIVGDGYDAEPINDGRCCDRSNWETVVPARLRQMRDDAKRQDRETPSKGLGALRAWIRSLRA